MATEELSISLVRDVVSRVLDEVERERGASIPVEYDYYWSMPIRSVIDLEHLPTDDLTIGRVADDLAELREMVDRDGTYPAWHSLAHVIGALRVIEHAVQP
jgi:hypothetical protein